MNKDDTVITPESPEKPELLVDFEAHEQAKTAFAAKVQARVQMIRKRASNAVRRLLKARPKSLPRPKTPHELVALIEYMAKTPRAYGVFLTKPELRAIEEYHALWRQAQSEQQPDPTTADVSADLGTAPLRVDTPTLDRLGDGSGPEGA